MRKLLVATFVALITAGCGGYSGPYTWTWPSGQKFAEAHFKNGKENGPYTEWHKDGKKSSEGSYKDGKKDGVWIYYNFDGKYVLYRKTFKEGIEVDLSFF